MIASPRSARAAGASAKGSSQRWMSTLAQFRPFSLVLAVLAALAVAPGFVSAQVEPVPSSDDLPLPRAPRDPSRVTAPDGLTAELMYRLLVGDIALQRGEPALAARAYFEAARETRDPTLARRATEVGVSARA